MPMVYSLEAKRAIRMVVHDMSVGLVPMTVTRFSELHDYVDANEYLLEAVPDHRPIDDASMEVFNDVSDEVDWWLMHLKTRTDIRAVRAQAPAI